MSNKKVNQLIHETSPYLLQHAYNPVNWYPWGTEALDKAVDEDKAIVVSVGYSACHWCHVMERETFEKEAIAEIMNKHYICIKVDREERPDVDQIYMDALHAMGLQGGWPMHVFLTPDQKPFYGGTYFPPEAWIHLLKNIAVAFQSNRKELEESAENFAESLNQSEAIKYGLLDHQETFDAKDLDTMYQKLMHRFDKTKGGMMKAPKFPMPCIWMFLIRYHHLTGKVGALDQVVLTMEQMARGGIYDQIGGGFARYAVDSEWFAPHFEKMLYDNGQLVSLYAEAYRLTKSELFKKIVVDTVAWVKREMCSPDGGFYAALDADSEGKEGKFYVWTADELRDILATEAELFMDYYGVSENGNWEDGNNILKVAEDEMSFAKRHQLNPDTLHALLHENRLKLLAKREERVRPGLDDKILTAWNGLMLKGLCDAYAAFNDASFLKMALKNARFLEKQMLQANHLKRTFKNGKASLNGYLDDYAFVIEALITLHQVTLDDHWLELAERLATYTIDSFYDPDENLFFYTDINSDKLIARKKELLDNVIPASNSTMAQNLFLLGIAMDNPMYTEIAYDMVSKVMPLARVEPEYLANWGKLLSMMARPTAEIAIVGAEYKKARIELEKTYYPHKIVMGASRESSLPLMRGKNMKDGQTTIFVCYNKTCKLPVHTVQDAISQLL